MPTIRCFTLPAAWDPPPLQAIPVSCWSLLLVGDSNMLCLASFMRLSCDAPCVAFSCWRCYINKRRI